MEPVSTSRRSVLMYTLIFIFLVFIYQFISSPMVISVVGVGETSAPAQKGSLTFSVSATGENSSVALSGVKFKAGRIRESLKSNGIADNDIYESQASVYPSSVVSAGASGFTADISMGLKTSDVLRLDALTSTIYSQGATVVTQPVLSAEDANSLNTEAFQLALKDANAQAGSIALKNLKFIKKVVLVQEQNTQGGSVTSKDSIDGSGVLRVNKVLQVSYKMW